MTARALLCATLCAVACRRPTPAREAARAPLRDAAAEAVAATASDAGAEVGTDAGREPVAIVRVRNVSTVPITIMTNPDVNEMLHTWRVNVPADRPDRVLVFVNDPALLTRVKLFPVDLPRCDADASAGFGGLGQTGSVVIAPGEARDIGTWDGLQREEVVDPARGGVCLREYPAPPGRYRFHFDNPHQLKPECPRVVFRVPLERDGGVPVIEFRCTPRPDGAVVDEE